MEKMASSSRRQNPTLEEQLFEEGYRFEFYQAVKLLEKLAEEAKNVLNVPIEIRFFSKVSTAFPASDVNQVLLRGVVEMIVNRQRREKVINLKDFLVTEAGQTSLRIIDLKEVVSIQLDEQTNGRLKRIELAVEANFMGLAGALGPLPLPYTELIIERVWKKDTALRDFLDFFNHRLISFLYRARKTQRLGSETHTPWQSHFAHYLFALIGLGTPGLQNRLSLPDHPLLFYTGLFGHQVRSFSALENLLSDFFQVQVHTEAWVGQWQLLPDSEYTYLGQNQQNQPLKSRPIIGTRVWDQQNRFGLHLGPMSLKQFRDFLPTGKGYKKLCELTRFFVGEELDFEIHLILKPEDIPEIRLSHTEGSPLGWISWAKTQESQTPVKVKLLPQIVK